MTSSETVEKLRPSTAVRYPLRSLLWATAILAVAASLGGTYLRSRPETEQPYVLTLWGSGFGFFTVWMLGYSWLRHSVEKKVGTVYYRLPRSVFFGIRKILPVVPVVFMLIFTIYYLVSWTGACVEFAEGKRPLWNMTVFGFNLGIFLSASVIGMWWGKELWIGEYGIAWDATFRSWEDVEEWHPHERYNDTFVLDPRQSLLDKRVAVRVPEQEAERLAGFLLDKLGAPVAPGSAGG